LRLNTPYVINKQKWEKKYKPSSLIMDLECARLALLEMMHPEQYFLQSSEDQDTLV